MRYEVIPSRRWHCTETGRTASAYGAHPGPTYTLVASGWTIRVRTSIAARTSSVRYTVARPIFRLAGALASSPTRCSAENGREWRRTASTIADRGEVSR